MFYYYDATYILVLIGAALSLWASWNVNGLIRKYQQVRCQSGLTAAQAAETILHGNDIYDVTVKMVSSGASDYYNPSTKEVCLLQSNYNSTSVASIGIAAHECGHAIQDATGYTPLLLQRSIAPVCSIGSSAGIYIVIAGLLFSMDPLVRVGIVLFALGVFLSLLLLPIEFDASNRALAILKDSGMMTGEDLSGARKVLRAAGLTYVAAAASALLSLLRLLLIANRRRR